MAKKAEDWIHRTAGMAAQFESMDHGRTLSIDFTTILGQASDDAWIVQIDGSETDYGEYWWAHTEYLAISGTEEKHTVDDATDEQVAQVTKEVPGTK